MVLITGKVLLETGETVPKKKLQSIDNDEKKPPSTPERESTERTIPPNIMTQRRQTRFRARTLNYSQPRVLDFDPNKIASVAPSLIFRHQKLKDIEQSLLEPSQPKAKGSQEKAEKEAKGGEKEGNNSPKKTGP